MSKTIYKKLYFKYLLSLLWTVVVLYLSLAQFKTDGLPRFRLPHFDKIVHFSMYFIYTFLLLFESKTYNKLKTYFIIIVYTICFGIIMEVLQSYTSYRSSDVYDALFNSLGSITSAILFSKLHIVIRRILG